ncbi:MAG TPA: 23S rRNA (pseudouridine(1915)-N(3))-methyltransferase RlmH [Candidatus Atribacteria bacterium]|nr:23S rRNA (pseudouridine(1915)-N(3))-methyltransferase RlmH [Candidatus Atribacteria bacterium]HPT78643.1 23S rRNA (pseudouridine(1915)-N(3))-methyltransferase RlmH [Candidatus Atribacteria bacterium]
MNIRLICVGKLKEKYLSQGISEYMKRLSRYAKAEIIEVEDEKAPESLSPADEAIVKEREAARIARHLREGSVKIILAIEGRSLASEEFAERLRQYGLAGKSQLDFVIGGSLGLDRSIADKADLLLSFSRFTFPHQLMRLILLEQIYRAFRIINNEPYHK